MPLTFDGTDDRVTAASAAGFPTAYPFSLACIVNFGAVTRWNAIFQLGNGSAEAGNGVYLEVTNTNTVQFQIAAGNNIGSITTGTVAAGIWYFISCSAASATSRRVLVYNLGTRAITLNETFTASKPVVAPAARFRIGAWGGLDATFDDHFQGTIDWVAVYNRDLTGQGGDLLLTLAQGGPLVLGAPTNYWSLREKSGTSAADLYGGNSGTLVNFPASPWVEAAIGVPRWLRGRPRRVFAAAAAVRSEAPTAQLLTAPGMVGRHYV